MQRREFLGQLGIAAGALSFVGTLLKGLPASAAELIDMTGKSKDPKNATAMSVAKGLNYVHDLPAALKSGKIKKTEKKVGDKTYAAKEQTCATCNFYKATKDGMGTCTLIPGVLVKGEGSCNSWVPAPAKK